MNKLKTLLDKARNKIAFYPIIISFGFVFFSFLILQLESNPNVEALKDQFPNIFVQNAEAARTILSVLIGGILSLTVFSFSMVMLVLNQASANYSPRLLPGLISDRRHQIILGFYIGYIIYLLIILISVPYYQSSSGFMGLSVMIAAILGIFSIFLFMYFIHNISQSVQVQNIVEEQYLKSKLNIGQIAGSSQHENNSSPIATKYDYKINKTGYYLGYNKTEIPSNISDKNKVVIEVVPFAGQFLFPGDLYFKSNEKIADEHLKKILENAPLGLMQISDDNYFSGMIRLMEVAVKAMSPGINDPGTAIDVIHRLSKLLEDRIHLPDQHTVNIGEQLTIINNEVPLDEVMRQVIAPIRNYSKSDASVLYKLKSVLNYLLNRVAKEKSHRNILIEEIELINEDAKKGISNSADLTKILELGHY